MKFKLILYADSSLRLLDYLRCLEELQNPLLDLEYKIRLDETC